MKGGYKWLLLALLSLAYFFSQADRVLFGLLTIPIQEELHLTDLQIGFVNTALFVTLAFTVPIAGILGDRFNRKWVITVALMFWSLMTAVTGLVGGMCALVFFRSILTGGGEAFYGPSAYALLAAHHKETRSFALAVHQAALYLGLMFSGALVAWVLKAVGGWRVVFWVFGGSGFLLGVSFIWLLKDGERTSSGGEERVGGTFRAGCRAFFCCPTVVLNAIGFIAICFANNAYISWAPKFACRRLCYGRCDPAGASALPPCFAVGCDASRCADARMVRICSDRCLVLRRYDAIRRVPWNVRGEHAGVCVRRSKAGTPLDRRRPCRPFGDAYRLALAASHRRNVRPHGACRSRARLRADGRRVCRRRSGHGHGVLLHIRERSPCGALRDSNVEKLPKLGFFTLRKLSKIMLLLR